MVEDRVLAFFRQDNRATVILASLGGHFLANPFWVFHLKSMWNSSCRCTQVFAVNPSCDAVKFVPGLGGGPLIFRNGNPLWMQACSIGALSYVTRYWGYQILMALRYIRNEEIQNRNADQKLALSPFLLSHFFSEMETGGSAILGSGKHRLHFGQCATPRKS